LKELKTHQLPDDADYEMHEEYVMWNHWVETVDSLQERIDSLSEIAEQGLYLGESLSVGR
jgi:hypothetical protein